MRSVLFAAMVLLTSLSAAAADDKALQDEKKKLEGVWNPTSAEVDGKPVPDEQKPPKVEFKGDKLLGLGPEMTFALDPSKKPKHIDLVAKVGGMDIKAPAIYELSEDELKLCVPLAEKGKALDLKRPAGFDTNGAPVILIRFKRAK